LEEGNYQKVVLNAFDYYVNNIPEETLPLHHLFNLPEPKNDEERVTLYVKK